MFSPVLIIFGQVKIGHYRSSGHQYANLLHVQQNNSTEWQDYGYQTPAVHFHPESGIHICSAISGNSSVCWQSMSDRPQAGTWSTLEISQEATTVDGAVIYKIIIGEKEVFLTENTRAESFTNVNVFAAHPKAKPQPGVIKDLKIETKLNCADDTNLTETKPEEESQSEDDINNTTIIVGSCSAVGVICLICGLAVWFWLQRKGEEVVKQPDNGRLRMEGEEEVAYHDNPYYGAGGEENDQVITDNHSNNIAIIYTSHSVHGPQPLLRDKQRLIQYFHMVLSYRVYITNVLERNII